MAETDFGDAEEQLVALEKSLTVLDERITHMVRELATHTELLGEVVELVRRAAPLLDSPMARMAGARRGGGAAAALMALRGGGRG